MKALIFDMDGVLVDVSQSYRLAIKETAKFFLNKEVTDKDVQDIKNKGGYNNDWDATAAIIQEKGKEVEQKDIIQRFQEFYLGNNYDGFIKNETWLLKKETLQDLKKEFKLGIVTGRPKIEAEFALDKSQTKSFFDVIITMDDSDLQKPDPELLKIALEKLNCKEGYYIGDTIDDIRMAINANVVPIGVVPPGVDKSIKTLLKEKGAQFVLDDINKIKEVLRNQ